MKTKRTLWQAIGASAIIALIGFGMAGCDSSNNAALVTHTVTFNTHGGSTVASQNVEEGQMATRPADPARASHTFVNWYTAETGGSMFDFGTPITGPTTVHAKWAEQTASQHTVIFNTHGGRAVASQTVQDGGTATRPAQDPTRADLDFVNWYTAEIGGSVFDFGTPITGPTTVHARWAEQVVRHTVVFNSDGGTPTPPMQTVADEGFATLPNPAPTRTGYTLGGWFAPGATTAFAFATTPITENITLTAQWMAEAVPTGQWVAIPVGAASSTFTVSHSITDVAYGDGRWVAVSSTGNRMAHSTDGVNWTAITSTGFSSVEAVSAVAYSDGTWVAVGGTRVAHSTDGISWTSTNLGATHGIFQGASIVAVAYGNGRWVVVGSQGRMAHSTNGINWTAIPAGGGAAGSQFSNNNLIHDIAYGNGRWVAVGSQGRMAHSTNGINWTGINAGAEGSTFANNASIANIAYGNGMWIALGQQGGRMATSEDGINWTAIPAEDSALTSGTVNSVAYGNGMWIAVGSAGRMATSEDGLSWTTVPAGTDAGGNTFATNQSINGVAYGNGRWVAVGGAGRMAYMDMDEDE